MKPGKGWSSWQTPSATPWLRLGARCAVFGVLILAGCRSALPAVDRNLMADRGISRRNVGVAERYTVLCPDVLDIAIDNHPEFSGPHPIGIDGRIDLDPLGRPCVEGQTVEEIAQAIADLASIAAAQVQVRVADYRSHCIFLFGEVMGSQRAVPYQGQETVLDLLQRTGGITQGAAPENVFVVRPHVLDGGRPQVFHVDLRAIVLKHNDRTNLRLEPFDQVHVGETRRAGFEKCIPPCLRPLYESLCGWLPFPDAELEPKSSAKGQTPELLGTQLSHP
jgi:protein involved in polysaccharide export with SLBB domain